MILRSTISHFHKQPRSLPAVLSQDEVTHLIEMTRNRMHGAFLMVLYATGRRTEVSRLKVSDTDSRCMVVHVARGKGLRDRDVPLTAKLLKALGDYWRWKKPRFYLFPSKMGTVERPISDKTVWNICGPRPPHRYQEEDESAYTAAQLREAIARGRHGPAHHPVADAA